MESKQGYDHLQKYYGRNPRKYQEYKLLKLAGEWLEMELKKKKNETIRL